MDRLTLTRPDDWHLHVRDGAALEAVLPFTTERFGRAIIMPNLTPPVTTTERALAYRERILAAVPKGADFTPLMTLYLTDNTPPAEIERAQASGHIYGVKLYPAGATTNSDAGVTDIARCDATLRAMEACGMPLLIHGEVTDTGIDIFDRESEFIERRLAPLVERYSNLKVVFEHITTRRAVEFVLEAPERVGATITAHHLLLNRNDMLVGGIRPHHYCLPVLKRERDREALLEAATSGNAKFFLGTDSAPHARGAKESACGCAGSFTAPAAIELYAEAFASVDRLDRLEGFASFHGPDFYGLPRNREQITLERTAWQMPEEYAYPGECIIPLRAGGTIGWKLA
ncbi:dihydroorotase [Alkalilimnicola ehrlichii]|uniref:dihydroorotase n=1 Tax=Alkalilimnicola ehrlichii TaxID=351052 RepID=UPI000E2EC58D|nr:dihydroorotase [Alkalilimnicola ehrlichii]RFA24590.1 dihydroorotase [Alkalilimnicola ehrlichii]